MSISYLIEGECTPGSGPRFTWYRWVTTEDANEVIALKAVTATIKLSGKCPYDGVQGTDMQGQIVLSLIHI